MNQNVMQQLGGLLNANRRERAASVIVKAGVEQIWAYLLKDVVESGYGLTSTNQGARQFEYLTASTWNNGPQQVRVCVASLGQEACVLSVSAKGVSQSGIMTEGQRQRELIDAMIGKLKAKFNVYQSDNNVLVSDGSNAPGSESGCLKMFSIILLAIVLAGAAITAVIAA